MFTQQQQEKLLGALLAKPENSSCADCSSKSPCWVSLDFGVFICLNCSGAHRSLGPSITRVRSTKLDKWKKQWIWFMQLGNKAMNQFYECNKDALTMKKPNINSSLNEIKRYVNDKYVKKLYAPSDLDDPITRLKNGTYEADAKQQVAELQPPKKQQISKPVIPKVQPPKKKAVDIDLMGDFQSNADVPSTSFNGNTKKNEINFFDDVQPTNSNTGKLYNKEHFNSFSGAGAGHSTTGHFNFDDIFASHQKNMNPTSSDFNDFAKFTSGGQQTQNKANYATTNGPQPNNNYNFHQHYNTGTGNMHPNFNSPHQNPTNFNMPHTNFPQNNPYQQPHVTMNINMNMYPKVMNINLNNNPANPNPPQTFVDVKLDLNDFKAESAPKKQQPKQKSWVDQWK